MLSIFCPLKVGVEGIVAVCEFPEEAESVIQLSQRFYFVYFNFLF